jgi:acyl-CoA synthetase (AMP-forming)/AMP-acid ligase II
MYGGAPIHPSTLREMIDVFHCDLYNGFGAGTEAGGQSIFRPEDHEKALRGSPHLLGSIGKAQYGVDLKLCDEAGSEVPVDAVGEIWTRADTIMSGFLTPFTGERPPIIDGWFRGGDMARKDREGYLYLAGRRDDMVLRGGENIYPFEIEGVLQSHRDVVDVAVFGLPDPYWGEIVAAAVVGAKGVEITEADLQEFARCHLAKYKVPDRVIFVEELPRNSSGKADKPTLKRTYSHPRDVRAPSRMEGDRPR